MTTAKFWSLVVMATFAISAQATFSPSYVPRMLLLGRKSRQYEPYASTSASTKGPASNPVVYNQNVYNPSVAPFTSRTSFSSPMGQAIYAPAFSNYLAPFALNQRPLYSGIPIFASYLAPMSNGNLMKRIDQLPVKETSDKEAKPAITCLLHHLTSETYPVYVLPPKNFQPIIYHQTSPMTGYIAQIPIMYNMGKGKSAEERWYESEMPIKSTKYSQNAFEDKTEKRITFVPVSESGPGQLPIYEAVVEKVNAAENVKTPVITEDNRNPYSGFHYEPREGAESVISERKKKPNYKTKLPVGVSSFFLGGARGVTGRHWNLPNGLVKQMEFMPNLSPIIPDSKYYPDATIKPADDDQLFLNPNLNDQSEMEEHTTEYTNQYRPVNKFDSNTIVDSELDLEAQESRTMNSDSNRARSSVNYTGNNNEPQNRPN